MVVASFVRLCGGRGEVPFAFALDKTMPSGTSALCTQTGRDRDHVVKKLQECSGDGSKPFSSSGRFVILCTAFSWDPLLG